MSETLSNEDFARLVGVSWRAGESLSTRMNAAYRFGIERARVVAPLVFTQQAYSWQEAEPFSGHRYTLFNRDFATWVCRFQGDIFDYCKTEEEAKAACQKHHAEFVLSQLEEA